MNQVVINSDFRVTIPKSIRNQYDIKPGQKVTITADGSTIKVTPEKEPFFNRKISRPVG